MYESTNYDLEVQTFPFRCMLKVSSYLMKDDVA